MGKQTGLGDSEQTVTDLLEIVVDSHREGHETLMSLAGDAIANAPVAAEVVAGTWSIAEAELFHAADAMKEWFEFLIDDLDLRTLKETVVATLAQSALSDVDWHELASSYIRRVKENA